MNTLRCVQWDQFEHVRQLHHCIQSSAGWQLSRRSCSCAFWSWNRESYSTSQQGGGLVCGWGETCPWRCCSPSTDTGCAGLSHWQGVENQWCVGQFSPTSAETEQLPYCDGKDALTGVVVEIQQNLSRQMDLLQFPQEDCWVWFCFRFLAVERKCFLFSVAKCLLMGELLGLCTLQYCLGLLNMESVVRQLCCDLRLFK